MEKNEPNEIIIYQGEDGQTHIDVKFTDKTVCLSHQQMAELYQTTRPNIVQHIRNIYADSELDELSTCKIFYRFAKKALVRSLERFLSITSI